MAWHTIQPLFCRIHSSYFQTISVSHNSACSPLRPEFSHPTIGLSHNSEGGPPPPHFPHPTIGVSHSSARGPLRPQFSHQTIGLSHNSEVGPPRPHFPLPTFGVLHTKLYKRKKVTTAETHHPRHNAAFVSMQKWVGVFMGVYNSCWGCFSPTPQQDKILLMFRLPAEY